MPVIDRANCEDAEKVVEHLLPDRFARKEALKFLVNAIIYANGLGSDNWNLNLDKRGKFVRFNTGRVYCVQISADEILILGLRETLREDLIGGDLEIEFRGHRGRKRVSSRTMQYVPDCLEKVPDSVGCVVSSQNIVSTLPYLETANRHFISYAINHTKLSMIMRNAHSSGFIEYLSKFSGRDIPNPLYASYAGVSEVNRDVEVLLEQETERQAIINSRIGQGKFRDSLIKFWGSCAITGCSRIDMLRASHIKPWSEASNQERLDVHNGLLLIPNLDAAFDAGYISFDDEGKIMISETLADNDRNRLGIHPELKITGLAERHIGYLQYHRNNKFKNV